MLYRTLFVSMVLVLVHTGCTNVKEVQEPSGNLSMAEKEEIRKEIRIHMDSVIKGLNTNDPELIFADFWRSDSTRFMLNGHELKGYDQIVDAFRQGVATRKNTEVTLHDDEVMVLDRNSAMHLAGFTNAMILENDSMVRLEGYWNAVFKKMEGQWKVVLVHESYNPVTD